MITTDGWDTDVDFSTLLFRPELAVLMPWEVVCDACHIAHYKRLPGCPDPDCEKYARL